MAPADTEALILTNQALVGAIVRDCLPSMPPHIDRDDLLQTGMLALVTSAQAFDPGRGVPFGRFAAIRIRGAIVDEQRREDWAPRTVRPTQRRVNAARLELATTLHRRPTPTEVATAAGLTVAELHRNDLDVATARLLQLDLYADDPAFDTRHGPEQAAVERDTLTQLHTAVNGLPKRCRSVVIAYYLQERMMQDIADEIGVTESRVSQLRSEGIRRLRAVFEEADLIAA